VRAASVWEDLQKYLYLPRLRHRTVLEQAILKGAASRDFFATAYGHSGEQFEGFKFGDSNIQVDDTLLLVEPAAATAFEAGQKQPEPRPTGEGMSRSQPPVGGKVTTPAGSGGALPISADARTKPGSVPPARAKAFFGSVDVSATTAKMKLVSIAEEIIAVLASDPNATVKVTLEISADFPNGASEQTKRAVAENAGALGFKSKLWE
jgi:hypothetical protein